MTTTAARPTRTSVPAAAAELEDTPTPGRRDQVPAVNGTSRAEFSLALSDEQLHIQQRAHDLAANVIRPAAHEWDERAETPWPVIAEAARAGVYTLDVVANALADPCGLLLPVVMEELAWGDAGIGLAVFGTALAVAGIMADGTTEQVDEWLPVCFEGDDGKVKLAAFGVSEPDAVPSVSAMRSQAVYDEAKDEWILNGTVTLFSNGGIAGVNVLDMPVDPQLGARGRASFVVPSVALGLAGGRGFTKFGVRASLAAEVILEGCRIPGRCVLGGKQRLDDRLARAREGTLASARPAMTVLEAARPAVGAQAVGISRAAYEYALEFATQRKRYGRAIVEEPAIAFMLADMKMRTDAARLLVWRAGWTAAAGEPRDAADGSMAQLYAGESAVLVADQAIRIVDGYGFVDDYPLMRWQRDAESFTMFEGVSEVERRNLARAVPGERIRLTKTWR